MKIYDISQEILTSIVYPGDTSPSITAVRRTARGDLYNLTDFNMCAHNGTHIDAPFHFLGDGKTVDRIPLEKTAGICFVAEFNGNINDDDAENIIIKSENIKKGSSKRILLKGNVIITDAAAKTFAEAEIYLIGVESQSVGNPEAPMAVHKILLKKEIVLLEGIRLNKVNEGVYFLSASPINLGGCDGAPTRAILIEGELS